MEILDTSVFVKDDFSFKSLNGTEYIINGNLSTEFYMFMLDMLYSIQTIEDEEKKAVIAFNELKDEDKTPAEKLKLQKIKLANQASTLKLLKDFCFKLISLDKTKKVTKQTVDDEFDNFQLLYSLFGKVITMLTSQVNNPN